MHHANPSTQSASPRSKGRARLAGLLRVAALFACVLAASLWWLARTASAELSERALSAGRELERWAEPAAGAGATLRINGQLMTLRTASTDLPVATVLDRFAALCRRDSGGTADELAALDGKGDGLHGLDVDNFGVLRSATESEGTAACFARSGAGGLEQLLSAVTALAERGDLQGFGQFRYLFVRKAARSPGLQHIVTVTSDGPLSLLEMWPERGDAPGRDLPEGVRPPEATRTLAAEAPLGYAINGYESARAPDEALASYAAQLAGRGYREQGLSPARAPGAHAVEPSAARGSARVWSRGNEVLIVFATDAEGGAGSLVSVKRIVRPGYTGRKAEGG